MSKELSPLEALERIKNAPTIYVGCASDIYTRFAYECKKIEKALKRLESIEDTRFIILGGRMSGKSQKLNALLKLKALEIIKEKKVDIGLLIRCLNAYCIDSACQEYNQWTQEEHLTYEECVLLKEVML